MKSVSDCIDKIKNLFGATRENEDNSRIEAAKITSNRLKALQRMRENSPYTPDYKLEPEPATKASKAVDSVDLDFGMEIKARG